MAIFSKKQATEKVETKAVKTVVAKDVDSKEAKEAAALANPVILEPHVTEKSSIQSEQEKVSRVYTFKVANTATKLSISRAIKAAYKVSPIAIRTARRADKPINYRGRPATKSGFKKAFITLKKGDKIEFA